jgi:hypothetical protein
MDSELPVRALHFRKANPDARFRRHEIHCGGCLGPLEVGVRNGIRLAPHLSPVSKTLSREPQFFPFLPPYMQLKMRGFPDAPAELTKKLQLFWTVAKALYIQ